MTGGLIVPAAGALDFVSLGALVHRLDAGLVPFRKAARFDVHVSGGEFNVAANLADCFGLKTAIVSAMVDYPIGALIEERVRAMGVRPFYRRFAHDGVRGPNMATVFSDRGHGVRPPTVFYNRAEEAAALLRPGDIAWSDVFAGGVRWFHTGGIFAALSESTPDLILEGIAAARRAGAIVSFDLNFRAKLWAGQASRAIAVLGRIVEQVDVLVGNEKDLTSGLGIEEARAGGSQLDPATFLETVARVRDKFPNLRVLATTLREVISTNRHRWSAVAWIGGQAFGAPICELDVFDRVGGGDGFAAGLFYGLLAGESPETAVRLGWAHGALLTTYPGDTTMATLDEVRALADSGGARGGF